MKNLQERQIAEARREYFNNWRANHKEKVKEYNKKFWTKRAEIMQNKASGDAFKP